MTRTDPAPASDLSWLDHRPTDAQLAEHARVAAWLWDQKRMDDFYFVSELAARGCRTIYEFHRVEGIYAEWRTQSRSSRGGASPALGEQGAPSPRSPAATG